MKEPTWLSCLPVVKLLQTRVSELSPGSTTQHTTIEHQQVNRKVLPFFFIPPKPRPKLFDADAADDDVVSGFSSAAQSCAVKIKQQKKTDQTKKPERNQSFFHSPTIKIDWKQRRERNWRWFRSRHTFFFRHFSLFSYEDISTLAFVFLFSSLLSWFHRSFVFLAEI